MEDRAEREEQEERAIWRAERAIVSRENRRVWAHHLPEQDEPTLPSGSR